MAELLDRESLARQALVDPEASDEDRAQARRVLGAPPSIPTVAAQEPTDVTAAENQPTPSSLPPAPNAPGSEPKSLRQVLTDLTEAPGRAMQTAANFGLSAATGDINNPFFNPEPTSEDLAKGALSPKTIEPFLGTGVGAAVENLFPGTGAASVSRGAREGLSRLISAGTSPASAGILATAPLLGEGKLVEYGLAGAFEAQALLGLPDVKKAWDEAQTTEEKTAVLTEAAGSIGLPIAPFVKPARSALGRLRDRLNGVEPSAPSTAQPPPIPPVESALAPTAEAAPALQRQEAAPVEPVAPVTDNRPIQDRLNDAQRELADAKSSGNAEAQSAALQKIDAIAQEYVTRGAQTRQTVRPQNADELEKALGTQDTVQRSENTISTAINSPGNPEHGANFEIPVGATTEEATALRDAVTNTFRGPKDQIPANQAAQAELLNKIRDRISGKEPPPTETSVQGLQTTEVPLSDITLSTDVPQFKAGANEKGVVEPLEGKYDRTGTAPVQLWRRLNGKLELISGRHRLDLAQRTGEKTIPSQIHNEADGFGPAEAARLDAELNIRDNQGSTADYANYFKNAGIDQADAETRGLLARAKGKAGFSISQKASDDVFALHQSGKITDSQAVGIAEAAPNNPGAQAVGVRAALSGKSAEYSAELIRAALSNVATGETPDLLNFDETALKAMDEQAKRAVEAKKAIREQISAVQGAAKKPDVARKLGVNVDDPEGVQKRVVELKAELERWQNWPSHPDLVEQTGGMPKPAATEPAPITEKAGTGSLQSTVEIDGHPIQISISTSGTISFAEQGNQLGSTGIGAFKTMNGLFPHIQNLMRAALERNPDQTFRFDADPRKTALYQRYLSKIGIDAKPSVPFSIPQDHPLRSLPASPKLRPGEQAGDLFQGTDQPFNLAGETAVDTEKVAAEKAAAEKAAATAKAELEKAQTQLQLGEEPLPPQSIGAARAGEIPEPRVTGLKNRIVDQERIARGWLPLMEPARQSNPVTWDRAMQIIEDGERSGKDVGAEMVQDVLNRKKKSISPEDQAILQHERIRISNERDMAAERASDQHASEEDRALGHQQWVDAEDRLNDADLALHEAGTISGRALQFRQSMIRDDYTFAGMERRARAAKEGPLEEGESQQIQQTADQIAEADKKATEREAQADEEKANKQAEMALDDLQKKARKQRKAPSTEDEAKLLAALEKRVGEGDTLKDVQPLIQKLALYFTRRFNLKQFRPLVKVVHDVVKDFFPDATPEQVRDAISGYGDFKELSKDQAKVQLRQMKGEMQQAGKLENMLGENEPPKKTGIERRSPSDLERRMIQKVNEAKKLLADLGIEATDPAKQLKGALDAIKTRLRNNIRDLDNSIATGDPLVSKRGSVAYDAEAQALRDQRDALKKQYDEIFGTDLTDEQRLKIATRAATDSLALWEKRLADARQGKFVKKEFKPDIATPDLAVTRLRRDAAREEYKLLHDLANPKRSPTEIALQSYKTRTQTRIAELEGKIARGDFTTTKRVPIALDKEAMALRAKAQALRDEFDTGILRKRLEDRTPMEKAYDTFVKYRRGFVLSWPTVFQKLSSAALLRVGSHVVESYVGAGLGRLPGLRSISERAAIEGGSKGVTAALAKSLAEGFTTGMKDSWQTLRTGRSDLDRTFGRREIAPRSWIDFFGTLHAVLKAPIKRLGFEYAMQRQFQWGIRNGIDVRDPAIQAQFALNAYAHGSRQIFLQDNRLVDAYRGAIRRLNQVKQDSELIPRWVPSGSKTLALAAETELPIVKVPTNIVGELIDYATGLVSGGTKAAAALRLGVEKLPTAEADVIMRQLKKGSVGAALLATGYFLYKDIGGYHKRGEHRGDEDVGPGEIEIGGKKFGHNWFHSAIAGPLMIGSTIRRVQEDQSEKPTPPEAVSGFIEALLESGTGALKEVPFVREAQNISRIVDATNKQTAVGQWAKGIFIPGVVQHVARQLDTDEAGNPTPVQPTSFLEAIQEGVPGLRNTLPRKKESRHH